MVCPYKLPFYIKTGLRRDIFFIGRWGPHGNRTLGARPRGSADARGKLPGSSPDGLDRRFEALVGLERPESRLGTDRQAVPGPTLAGG